MPINWLYGTPISGICFPLVTASGTYAKEYDVAQISSVISKDGGAWNSLGSRISSIPGDGVYSITSLSSVEMQCYTWFVKITANSGCLDQGIMGINMSGPVLTTDISGFAHSMDCSGNSNILTAVSGLNTSNLIAQCSSIIGACSAPSTLIAGQTVYASGLFNLLGAVSTPVTLVAGQTVYASGLFNILGAVSGVISGVAGIATTDALTIASGTLAEDLRRLRWFAWENLNIDKRYSPVRLYLKTDATNYSSYFNLDDDVNNTTRTRGG